MDSQQKRDTVNKLKEKFKDNPCAIVTGFQGMDVASMQKLRREVKSRGLEFSVVKNKLLLKAMADFDFAEELKPYLKGMTAVAWSPEDPSAPAKVIKDYQKENDKLKIKCGLLEGKVLDPDDVSALASLPSKDQILASLLSLFETPARQFLSLMQAPLTNFLGLLENYRKEKEG
ncbi:MAG: 50S ribosomal protein L10 [Pseudomonadota bacterium]